MNIRKAQTQDLEKIISLNEELFLLEKDFSDKYNLSWSKSDRAREYFKNRIEAGIVFVADENGTVGYICGQAWDNYHSLKSPNHAELENMFVKEEYRGKGIGKLLTSAFEKECKKRGADSIRVQSILKNEGAVKFYQQIGYIPEWLEFYKKL